MTTPPLSRVMPCPNCGCEMHLLRCNAENVPNGCPCRDVAVPGVYIENTP